MLRPDLSHNHSEFAALSREYVPAHSGPELATCVPDPRLAQDLARELLAEQFELSRSERHPTLAVSGGYVGFGGLTIGLARR